MSPLPLDSGFAPSGAPRNDEGTKCQEHNTRSRSYSGSGSSCIVVNGLSFAGSASGNTRAFQFRSSSAPSGQVEPGWPHENVARQVVRASVAKAGSTLADDARTASARTRHLAHHEHRIEPIGEDGRSVPRHAKVPSYGNTSSSRRAGAATGMDLRDRGKRCE